MKRKCISADKFHEYCLTRIAELLPRAYCVWSSPVFCLSYESLLMEIMPACIVDSVDAVTLVDVLVDVVGTTFVVSLRTNKYELVKSPPPPS